MSEDWGGVGWRTAIFFIISHVEVFDILKQYIYYIKIKIKLKKKRKVKKKNNNKPKIMVSLDLVVRMAFSMLVQGTDQEALPQEPKPPQWQILSLSFAGQQRGQVSRRGSGPGSRGCSCNDFKTSSQLCLSLLFHFFPKLNNLSFTLPCFGRCH